MSKTISVYAVLAETFERKRSTITVSVPTAPNEFIRKYNWENRHSSLMPAITSVDELEATPHAEVFDERNPRTVRLRLEADDSVPAHRHPESNVVLHLLEGEVELTLGDEVYTLESGDIAQFDGDQDISPHAIDESTALLVFAPKTDS